MACLLVNSVCGYLFVNSINEMFTIKCGYENSALLIVCLFVNIINLCIFVNTDKRIFTGKHYFVVFTRKQYLWLFICIQ